MNQKFNEIRVCLNADWTCHNGITLCDECSEMYVRTCVVCGEHVTGMVPDDDDFSNASGWKYNDGYWRCVDCEKSESN